METNKFYIILDEVNEDVATIQYDVLYLNNNIDNLDDIQSAWKRTYNTRQKMFDEEKISLEVYFDRFPCLTQPYSKCLVTLQIKYSHQRNFVNFYNYVCRWK